MNDELNTNKKMTKKMVEEKILSHMSLLGLINIKKLDELI